MYNSNTIIKINFLNGPIGYLPTKPTDIPNRSIHEKQGDGNGYSNSLAAKQATIRRLRLFECQCSNDCVSQIFL